MIDPKESNVTLEQLKKVRIHRLDEAGGRYQALPHHRLIEALKVETENRGWKLENLRCVLNKKKTEMTASLDVTGLAPPRKGMTCCLGVINSTAQRKRLWLFAGLRLDKPKCGVILGKYSVVARRTTHLDLEQKVRESLNLFEEEVKKFPDRIARMEKHKLSLKEAFGIIEQAGEGPHPNLSDSRVRKVKRAIETKGEVTTQWNLLVEFAIVNQKASPHDQMDRCFDFLKENLEE